MQADIYNTALRYATIVRDSTNSNGKAKTHVKRDNVIAVLTYQFAGTNAIGQGRVVTREFLERLAQDVGGTYELNPARIVFSR